VTGPSALGSGPASPSSRPAELGAEAVAGPYVADAQDSTCESLPDQAVREVS